MDAQSPPTDAVAPEALTVSDEPPPHLAAEDAPLVVPDTVAPGALTVSDEPPPLGAENVPLVVPGDAASLEASEVGAGGVVLTDELRYQIVKQVLDARSSSVIMTSLSHFVCCCDRPVPDVCFA